MPTTVGLCDCVGLSKQVIRILLAAQTLQLVQVCFCSVFSLS